MSSDVTIVGYSIHTENVAVKCNDPQGVGVELVWQCSLISSVRK